MIKVVIFLYFANAATEKHDSVVDLCDENGFMASAISPLLFCVSFSSDTQVTTVEMQYPVKEEEENAMHNTVVIFSSNDSFTLKQVPFHKL